MSRDTYDREVNDLRKVELMARRPQKSAIMLALGLRRARDPARFWRMRYGWSIWL